MNRLDLTLGPAVAALAGVILLCHFTGMDLAVQDRLFDFEARRWMLPRDSSALEFTFHRLPKYCIMAFGAVLLVWPLLCRRWKTLPVIEGRRVSVVILTLALTTAMAGTLKRVTRSHCPWSVTRYGGPEPYVKPLSRYDACCPATRPGACWPAGHASGGFALVSLASLSCTPRGRRRGWLTGLTAGWITGGYQMLKGAHYLSDTLVTMLLAWTFHLLLRRLLLKPTESLQG